MADEQCEQNDAEKNTNKQLADEQCEQNDEESKQINNYNV